MVLLFARVKKKMYFCGIETIIGFMNDEERLIRVLQLSHSQIVAGRSFSQEEAERFLDQRLYEFRDKMVGTGAAESC